MKNKNTQGNEIKEDAKSFVSITLKQTKDVKVKKLKLLAYMENVITYLC